MKTILYVDDEPALLDVAQLFLEKTSEFKVLTAESAKEGLEIFRTRHPDAIVSDYQMPEMNGIEFLKEVRRESAVPFIMFTGRGNEMIAMESTNSGSDYYIQKGADPRALFAELTYKIRLALSDRREETEEQRSKKTIRTLIDKTYDAVIIHNLEGRIFEVNSKMLDLYQLTREEALRFTIDELSGPGSPTAVRSDILKKVLAGEDQFLFWEARRPHDGTVFPIEKFLTRINFGQNLYILCNIRDVSDREKKKENEAAVVCAVDHAPDGIICTDLDGTIIFMNATWKNRLGITASSSPVTSLVTIDPLFTPEFLRQISAGADGVIGNQKSLQLTQQGEKIPVVFSGYKQTLNEKTIVCWYLKEISESF